MNKVINIYILVCFWWLLGIKHFLYTFEIVAEYILSISFNTSIIILLVVKNNLVKTFVVCTIIYIPCLQFETKNYCKMMIEKLDGNFNEGRVS